MPSVTVVSTHTPPTSETGTAKTTHGLQPVHGQPGSSAADEAFLAQNGGLSPDACHVRLRQLAQHAERVAHDFNDLLTLVMGHVTLAQRSIEDQGDASSHLEEIQRTAGQAAALSQQLLSFARLNSTPAEPLRKVEPRSSGYIVIAEDEPMVAELTRRILVQAGHRVRVTHDGQAALEAIRKEADDIELVVSDIVMPHMSGLELAKVLSEERPDLPLLLVSGYPEDDRRLSDETLASTPFLPKPFKAADLLAAIDSLLVRTRVTIG